MSRAFEKFFKSIFLKISDHIVKKILRKKNETPVSPDSSQNKPGADDVKSHPWRLCPVDKHWVNSHPLTIPANWRRAEYITTRRGHCRQNQGSAALYTADELNEIANQYFQGLRADSGAMPVPDALGFKNGNDYDDLIAGWTKFWNEVLSPEDPLSPDLVKALVATESSFIPPKDVTSKDGLARGLLQITENTRKILGDPKGELRNHLLQMTPEESRRADVNIAAGIRWLHHKRKLLEKRLKRKVTWEEAIAEYKGIFRQLGKVPKADDIMSEIRRLHENLKGKRK